MCVHFSFNITNHSLQIWGCFSILESIIRCFLLCILSTIHNWGKLYTGWKLLMRLWFGANLCEVNGCATGKKKKENHIDILMYSSKPHTWMDLFPHHSVQFSSVAQSCLTLCDPMNHNTTGLPVHHKLLESIQTHVHWVGDAIQPFHPLSFPSPLALNLSQEQGIFKWVSSSHQVAKYWSVQLQHQSFQWIFRTDFF